MEQADDSEPPPPTVADPLDLECWYQKLAPWTFPTVFIGVRRDEGQAIVDAYDDKKLGDAKTTPEKKALLEKLSHTLQDAVTRMHGKAFVRLSTRSPKDVALKHLKTKQILDAEIKALGSNDTVNQVIAIIRCCSRAMASVVSYISLQMESGEEALDFLVSSERVYQDLTRRLLATEWSMKIIVREWVPILPEWEFRGFVHNNTFTALTQYYKACYVPGMYEQREDIAKRVKACWAEAKDKMPTASYVVDFAVTPGRVFIIELNHFEHTTSSALFDWKADKKVLEDGPFELRIVQHPIPNVKALIARPLRALVGWSEEEVAASSDRTAPGPPPAESDRCCVS